MKKKILKIVSFSLAVVLFFTGAYNVLNFKYLDSIFKVKMFYKQPENSVDVLTLGSSHAYQGINTAVLWKEYGIAAYNLCGPAQPVWNTYYYLEEALKTQTPKAIILDTYTLHYSMTYSEPSFAIKNTYGLKMSKTKADAINASFDTEKAGNQYLFEVLQYHSRYSDLNKTDFYPYQANRRMYENYKGFYCYFKSTPLKDNDFSNVDYCNEIPEKSEEYYRKIIELAKSKNIPIIVVAIPFNAERYHVGFFNEGARIAAEYGVPFYNFITDYKDDIALDYKTDFSDTQHLNYKGNTKLTRFLGDVLRNEYSVPDRRGNHGYDSWANDAAVYYAQVANQNVRLRKDIVGYARLIKNGRYKVVVTVTKPQEGKEKYLLLSGAFEAFDSLGVSPEQLREGGVWIFDGGALVYYNDGEKDDFSKSVSLGRFNDALVKNTKVRYSEEPDSPVYTEFEIYANKEKVSQTERGINIAVYDSLTQSVIDSIGFDYVTSEFKRA